MTSPARVLLFDFGGTLDAEGVPWKDRFVRLAREEGLETPQADFDKAFYGATDSLEGTISQSRRAFEKPSSASPRGSPLRLGRKDALLRRVGDRFAEESLRQLAQSAALLSRLRERYRIGIVSNFYGNLQAVCDEAGLTPSIGVAIDSTLIGCKKPDPRIFQAALDAAGGVAGGGRLRGRLPCGGTWPARSAMGMRHVWLRPEDAAANGRSGRPLLPRGCRDRAARGAFEARPVKRKRTIRSRGARRLSGDLPRGRALAGPRGRRRGDPRGRGPQARGSRPGVSGRLPQARGDHRPRERSAGARLRDVRRPRGARGAEAVGAPGSLRHQQPARGRQHASREHDPSARREARARAGKPASGLQRPASARAQTTTASFRRAGSSRRSGTRRARETSSSPRIPPRSKTPSSGCAIGGSLAPWLSGTWRATSSSSTAWPPTTRRPRARDGARPVLVRVVPPEASVPWRVTRSTPRTLRDIACRAASALGLDIWGGDAIVTPAGEIFLIDVNAWPSFALYREEAADRIAAHLAARLRRDARVAV